MARSSEKVGRGPCPKCGERVTFHRTKGGMLNFECYGCDQSAYAHKNGESEREWMASLEPVREVPTPAMKLTPVAEAVQGVVQQKKQPFGIDQL